MRNSPRRQEHHQVTAEIERWMHIKTSRTLVLDTRLNWERRADQVGPVPRTDLAAGRQGKAKHGSQGETPGKKMQYRVAVLT